MSEFSGLGLDDHFGGLSTNQLLTTQKKCSPKDALKSLRNLMSKRSDIGKYLTIISGEPWLPI